MKGSNLYKIAYLFVSYMKQGWHKKVKIKLISFCHCGFTIPVVENVLVTLQVSIHSTLPEKNVLT